MVKSAHRWHGRRGAVLLGPTEHRVARYLEAATAHGRVTLRMATVADELRLGRSEAYRITARLRTLGLFGVENDRGGDKGGRRWWRTAREHDGPGLDPVRHREAWARITGWARRRRLELARKLRAWQDGRALNHAARPVPGRATALPADSPAAGSASFGQLLMRTGLLAPELVREFGLGET